MYRKIELVHLSNPFSARQNIVLKNSLAITVLTPEGLFLNEIIITVLPVLGMSQFGTPNKALALPVSIARVLYKLLLVFIVKVCDVVRGLRWCLHVVELNKPILSFFSIKESILCLI